MKPEPPRTEAFRAILGEGCRHCRTRWREADLVAASEREEGEHLQMLTAGGASVSAAVRGLENARRIVAQAGSRPTGRY